MRPILIAVAAALLGASAPARAESLDAAAAAAIRGACKEGAAKAYRVNVPAPNVDWKPAGLTVDLSRPFSFEGGAVELYRDADDDEAFAPLPMPAEQGAVFVRARANDKLTATLSFELVGGALVDAPCLSLAGGRSLRARYRPIRLELYQTADDGRAAKKPSAVFLPPGVAESERGIPRVQLGPLGMAHRSDEGLRPSLERALVELEPGLRRCYAEALQRRPGAGGRVVLGVAADKAKLTVARVELDSVGDPALTRCARALIDELRPPSGLRLSSFSLPIVFERR